MVDISRLGAQMGQQYFTCTVLDIPGGAFPKLITVRLPGIDGPANIARWFGWPTIAVGDEVICRRDLNNYDVLIVEGSGDEATTSIGAEIVVNNGSGATANAGDVGYIDAAGDYQTTTIVEDIVSKVVVIAGGATATDIKVIKGGRPTVNYTGTAPAKGDFLTTSATAGLSQARSTMHPAIFAVCTAAGSGGTVEALLLTRRTPVPTSLDNLIFSQTNIDTKATAWTGTINDGAPTTSPVTVATSTSNINTITPDASTNEGKIVLRNTTRSNEALIDSISGNDITFVDDTPLSTWVNGDSLTAQSDDNAQAGYQTIDLSGSAIPALAVAAWFHVEINDSGAVARFVALHPYESYNVAKVRAIEVLNTSAFTRIPTLVPIIERRFTINSSASGSGTFDNYLRVIEYILAAP